MTTDDKPTDWDRECMAWHEAGHAVCAHFLPGGRTVERISIVPGDEAFGLMKCAPNRRRNETEETLRAIVATELAGPLAERLFLHRVTTSGGKDFRMAYALASDMVVRFGMGRKTGLACPGAATDAEIAAFRTNNAERVEEDVRKIVFAARNAAETVLRVRSNEVRRLAKALLGSDSLDADALRRLGFTRT